MKIRFKVMCQSCRLEKAVIYWNQKYQGYRGFCIVCGNNWPES